MLPKSRNSVTCLRRCKHSPRDLSQIQSTLSKLTLSKCSAVHVTAVTDFTWPRRCWRHSPLITSQTRTPPLAAPLTTWRLLVWNKQTYTYPAAQDRRSFSTGGVGGGGRGEGEGEGRGVLPRGRRKTLLTKRWSLLSVVMAGTSYAGY